MIIPSHAPSITPASALSQLAVYVHWPFCLSKCPYCDFNSHVRDKVDQRAWEKALVAELSHMAVQLPGRQVGSVFFGGGTPSLMPPATVAAVLDAVASHWQPAADMEVTLEANPTSVEAANFRALHAAGVNRVSLGVQSLRQDDLAFLGRHHTVEEALRAVESAASIFSRYSFDLIYARPNQTLADWEEELCLALRYCGSHLSLYQLTLELGTAFYHQHQKGLLTPLDEDTSAHLFERTQAIMEAAGLPAYEVSNHAQPGEESRHNLLYWRGGEYVGIGPGAHGRLNLAEGHIATETLKSPERWLEAVGRQGHGLSERRVIEAREHAEERLMMGLRITEGLRLDAFESLTGLAWTEVVNPRKLEHLRNQGLVECDNYILRATPRGKLVLTALTAELLH